MTLEAQFAEHEKKDEVMRDNVVTLNRVIFGDEKTGEKGMKQKVDEMHELLVQASGLKRLGLLILLVAGVFAAFKGWGLFK